MQNTWKKLLVYTTIFVVLIVIVVKTINSWPLPFWEKDLPKDVDVKHLSFDVWFHINLDNSFSIFLCSILLYMFFPSFFPPTF